MPSPDVSQYPASLDTTASLMRVINNYATTLTSTINSSQTIIPLVSTSGLQAPGTVSIGSEVIYYLTITGNTLTSCIRGFDGTTAAAASIGSKVEQRWVAVHHNLLASAIAGIEQLLGLTIQGSELDLSTRLNRALPQLVPFVTTVSDWSFTHDRRRGVSVQLWRLKAANTYELFEANIEQVINSGGLSNVNITLTSAESGFAVIQ